MPIYDYHCHIPTQQIAADRRFENLTQAWLYGDHYKWRAMRTNGVDEKYITGDSSDYEKFERWAQTVPCCLRNPLYHWTHMELKNPFGIKDKLLGPETAKEIYESVSEMLRTPEFSTRNIMRKMNDYGVLGAYFPAFGHIVGLMQHDLFHIYTVDVHTLFVIRNLRRLTVPEFRDEHPLASKLMTSIFKPERLYLAALLHDIAKGRGGNHSEKGKKISISFCRQHLRDTAISAVSRQPNLNPSLYGFFRI